MFYRSELRLIWHILYEMEFNFSFSPYTIWCIESRPVIYIAR